MAETSGRISVEWHESFEEGKIGRYQPVHEGSNALEFVTPYDRYYSHTDKILEDIGELSTGQLGNTLNEDHDIEKPDFSNFNPISRFFRKRLLSRIDPKLKRFVWADLITTNSMALIGSAIRHAKVQPDGLTEMDGEEWADLAYEQINLDPEGKDSTKSVFGNWYEFCTGIKEPELQKKTLGRVALSIIRADMFAQPQKIAFRGNLATIQTSK